MSHWDPDLPGTSKFIDKATISCSFPIFTGTTKRFGWGGGGEGASLILKRNKGARAHQNPVRNPALPEPVEDGIFGWRRFNYPAPDLIHITGTTGTVCINKEKVSTALAKSR